jgi:hypothetical protein
MIFKQLLINEQLKLYCSALTQKELEDIELMCSSYNNETKKRIEKSILEKYNIHIVNIKLLGKTDEVSNMTLAKLIPIVSYAMRSGVNQYKCYVIETPSIVMHEDAKSSWKCILTKLEHPEYAIIYHAE